MPKLKILSGKNVIEILENFGFSVIGQKGSHTKLRRIENNHKQTLTVPNHFEFDSMINLKPAFGNRTRGVDNLETQNKIIEIVKKLVK